MKRVMFGLVAVLMLASLAAFAGTATMDFTGVGENSYNGAYTYPYNFTVTPSGQSSFLAALMCVSSNNEVTVGESWTANVLSVGQYGAYLGNTQVADQLAWLYEQAKNDGGSDPSINAAAWFVRASYLGEATPGMNTAASTWASDAGLQTFTTGEFNNVRMYVDANETSPFQTNTAQTFVGSTTPEPGTLLMFGSAIIGAAGFIRRKLV